MGGDLLKNSIKANVNRAVMEFSECEPILAEKVRNGRITIIGAFYNLETGEVTSEYL